MPSGPGRLNNSISVMPITGAGMDNKTTMTTTTTQRMVGTARASQIAWAEYLEVPGDEPLIGNSLGMQLVLIPPGRFTQGTDIAEVQQLAMLVERLEYEHDILSETPPRQVVIERPFWIGRTERSSG